jgi:antitoxin (DNA-binding transcriptional repressor) of toxin-antitoxin stability system
VIDFSIISTLISARKIIRTKTRTATVADLRNNFRRVFSWLADGQVMMITRRGCTFAPLTPSSAPTKPFKMPDFATQRKKIWGDRPPLTMDQVRDMRQFELEGEEG